MLDPFFGADVNPYDPEVPIMKSLLTGRHKDPMTEELALLEAYDTQYGLYNHNSQTASPGGVFHMHPGEDYLSGGLLEVRTLEIIHKRLPELLGTPFLDILKYPTWFLDFILKSASESKGEPTEAQIERDARAAVEKAIKESGHRP